MMFAHKIIQNFGDYVEHKYSNELEIQNKTDTVKSVSYMDLRLEIDNDVRLK